MCFESFSKYSIFEHGAELMLGVERLVEKWPDCSGSLTDTVSQIIFLSLMKLNHYSENILYDNCELLNFKYLQNISQ